MDDDKCKLIIIPTKEWLEPIEEMVGDHQNLLLISKLIDKETV